MTQKSDIVLKGDVVLESSSLPHMFVRRTTRGKIKESSPFSIADAGVVFVPGMRYRVTVEAIGEVRKLDEVWHADPVCRVGTKKNIEMYRSWLSKPNFVAWTSGSQGSHAAAKQQLPRLEANMRWSLGLRALRRRVAAALKAQAKQAKPKPSGEAIAMAALIEYITENEVDNFVSWFNDDGWDDDAVCKAIGKKTLSEDEANLVASAMTDGYSDLIEAVAYHAFGCDHVYSDAVTLNTYVTGKVPTLSKRRVREILAV